MCAVLLSLRRGGGRSITLAGAAPTEFHERLNKQALEEGEAKPTTGGD